jgi:hypothetical protein
LFLQVTTVFERSYQIPKGGVGSEKTPYTYKLISAGGHFLTRSFIYRVRIHAASFPYKSKLIIYCTGSLDYSGEIATACMDDVFALFARKYEDWKAEKLLIANGIEEASGGYD